MCDWNNSSTGVVVVDQEYVSDDDQWQYFDVAAAEESEVDQNIGGGDDDSGAGYLLNTEPKAVDPEYAILMIVENFHVLKIAVPDAKSRHLWGLAKECLEKEDSAKQYAEDLLQTSDYPVEVNSDDFCEYEEPDDEFNAAIKYSSLRSILPNADTTWVWDIAKEHADTNDDSFDKFVMHLLQTDDYPKFNLSAVAPVVGIELKKQELTQKAQKILHNVDARYIEQQLNTDTALGYNEEGVSQLILKCMDNMQQCPSKSEEYYRQVTQEAIEQYTGDFDIEKFLARFPEPVKYFENPTNAGGPKYRSDVLKYLRVVAQHLSREQIQQVQKTHVSLIRCHRNFFGSSVPDLTVRYKLTDECARFINELTYIRFYKIIVTTAASCVSLTDVGKNNDIAEGLLDDFDTMSCELCGDPVLLGYILTCTEGHMFCAQCVGKWVSETLGNGSVFVKCLEECNGTMPDKVLSRVLPEGDLEKIIKRRQERDIGAAHVDGIVNCLWCDYSYVPRTEDMDLVCLSPECGEKWCRKCRELAHSPRPCEDTPEEVEKRVFIEERMTNAAVRPCPRCGVDIVKDGGCDYVMCSCGAGICFNCGRIAAHHNCDRPRATFNVQTEGLRAKAEAEQLFPNVKLNYDPTRFH